MNTFLVTLVGFGVWIVLMAVGVIFGGRRITGSCGGLNGRVRDELGETRCGVCGRTVEEQRRDGCGDEEPSVTASAS